MSAPAATADRADTTLDAVLSPVHDAWVEEVRRFLIPATTPTAPFWDRWSVVRYLNDQFMERFGWERALVAELRPFVAQHDTDTLWTGAERVAQLRLALDRVGRRRGTAGEFALVTEEFLKALELWCAEIELAARQIERDALAEEGERILAHLEAARPSA